MLNRDMENIKKTNNKILEQGSANLLYKGTDGEVLGFIGQLKFPSHNLTNK